MATLKIAGVNFDHFHMGDLLRMVHEHPNAEIVGISDEQPERMLEAQSNFGLTDDQVFTDYSECLETTKPDVVILCPAAARHAEWTEKVAPFGVHILMEKPFAATLAEADRMIAAMAKSGKELAINWPLRWVASHVKTQELISGGAIGDVQEVHFYDGNRGPLWHGADKIEHEPTDAEKDASWFYKKAEGGGSLQDYLGYGTTLGTWFHDGKKPSEVMAMWNLNSKNDGLEVDEHSVTVARYPGVGLSKFETRWGTFSDPWVTQPQPVCGFVIKGTEGTIASPDYASTVRLQNVDHPEGIEIEVLPLEAPFANPVQYFLDCLESGAPIEGPLSIEMSRIGQEIVDAAFQSAEEDRAVRL
ncbi:Gfo/Idh/MocA family oxidoreductase [bacterium]|nr:Gfo/Idh/MocA family oxidoreductase [bacterium]MDB4657609.1 Gfo/Idh/MocA family oxidoreductase [Verrucomicrobiales bacterium]MDC0311894.1 Gfo/Idh/MocA family oxidoreductase [bacterium]MDC0314501.1 Gfo/Idh/MocA family oxidoreductase [bacterium]